MQYPINRNLILPLITILLPGEYLADSGYVYAGLNAGKMVWKIPMTSGCFLTIPTPLNEFLLCSNASNALYRKSHAIVTKL